MSMNLTPARGPSAWDRMERESKLDRVAISLVTAGAALSSSALWQRDRRRAWAIALGVASIAAGIFLHPGLRTARLSHRNAADEAIDRASADSFPASDPPSIPAADSAH